MASLAAKGGCLNQFWKVAGILGILIASACESADERRNNYHDEPFKEVSQPLTTAHRYISNYSGQKVALGQLGDVQTVRYFQNGKVVGMTQYATQAWFGLNTEDEMKDRVLRVLKKRHSDDKTSSNAISTYRGNQNFGAYVEKYGCVFISFYKRLKGFGVADNDGGAPDFVGLFVVCGGLTVTPEKFIRAITLVK